MNIARKKIRGKNGVHRHNVADGQGSNGDIRSFSGIVKRCERYVFWLLLLHDVYPWD